MANLNQPVWLEGTALCVACGYSIGTDLPCCPECGHATTGRMLVLEGVPEQSVSGPWYLRLLFPVFLIFTMVAAQLALVLGMRFGWMAPASILLLFIIGTVIFIRLMPRQRRSTSERFIFFTGGVSRLPRQRSLEQIRAEEITFIPFGSGARLEWKRVGPLWYKVRVLDTAGKKVFGAGVLCADADAGWVGDGLVACVDERAAGPGDSAAHAGT